MCQVVTGLVDCAQLDLTCLGFRDALTPRHGGIVSVSIYLSTALGRSAVMWRRVRPR